MRFNLPHSIICAFSLAVLLSTLCSLTHIEALASCPFQASRPVADGGKKVDQRPAADEATQTADSTSTEQGDQTANSSTDARSALSRIVTGKKAEFNPSASSWKPWGVTSQQTT